MFTVILLCVGLDVSQYRESGVSFSSKKTIIPLNLQMTLTKFWIKSDPQCHLADVPGGDVRQPLAVYDFSPVRPARQLRSDPDAHSRTIALSSQDPGPCAIEAHRKERKSEGEFPGS